MPQIENTVINSWWQEGYMKVPFLVMMLLIAMLVGFSLVFFVL